MLMCARICYPFRFFIRHSYMTIAILFLIFAYVLHYYDMFK
jgi:hypothetical protein